MAGLCRRTETSSKRIAAMLAAYGFAAFLFAVRRFYRAMLGTASATPRHQRRERFRLGGAGRLARSTTFSAISQHKLDVAHLASSSRAKL